MTAKRETVRQVHLEFFRVDDNAQDDIKDIIRSFLDERGCVDLLLPVFTCVNELVVNAVKANFKAIFFSSYTYGDQSVRDIPSEKAMQIFRLHLRQNSAEEFARIAMERNIRAELYLEVDEDGILHVRVVNPYVLTDDELESIKRRIYAVDSIRSLSDYFEQHQDDANKEGAGLGLIFIGLVLKSLSLPPQTLEYVLPGSRTEARISFPLNRATVESYLGFVDLQGSI